MNPDKLLDAIGMLDDRHFEFKKQNRVIPRRRRLAAFVAAILMLILSVGAAMAVSPEFRELVFRFFHIDQVQTIPESTVGSDISVDDMFVEPSISIGDVIQGTYVHTPVVVMIIPWPTQAHRSAICPGRVGGLSAWNRQPIAGTPPMEKSESCNSPK